MPNFNTRIELDSGEEIEIEVEFDYSPLMPEHVNCLPEDAYPAEGGEIDKISIKTLNSNYASLELSDLSTRQWQFVMDEAREWIVNN